MTQWPVPLFIPQTVAHLGRISFSSFRAAPGLASLCICTSAVHAAAENAGRDDQKSRAMAASSLDFFMPFYHFFLRNVILVFYHLVVILRRGILFLFLLGSCRACCSHHRVHGEGSESDQHRCHMRCARRLSSISSSVHPQCGVSGHRPCSSSPAT